MNAGILPAVLSAICFGALPILGKMGLDLGMSPLEVVQYRFGFGAVMLFSWLALTRPRLLKISFRTMLKAAVLGLGFYPFQAFFFIKSLQYIPASTTSLIFYFYPLCTALIAMAFLGLRPNRLLYLSLGIIMAGCGLIFHDAFARNLDVRGICCALVCMAIFSGYLAVIQVFTKNGEAKAISAWVILFTAIAFNLASSPAGILDKPMGCWLVALALGLIPTVLAVTLLYQAIESMGSTMAAVFSSIEPVVTVLLAAMLLDEHVQIIQILGMACIVTGIVMPNLSLIRRKKILEHATGA